MHAQDTGGAIRGAVRADFFWGYGTEAGMYAGRMKQSGSLWMLLPKGMTPCLPPVEHEVVPQRKQGRSRA
ncbi:3D domain-containing protein [Paludibacterium denitrificans]|uniref:3D domain-containing protein n=1 Tax=Paludibacterium denitrificans TaxID=2675226 RepID=UPI001E39A0A7|nr:3D domain-containing protein [Paludibacterium denitrificans]